MSVPFRNKLTLLVTEPATTGNCKPAAWTCANQFGRGARREVAPCRKTGCRRLHHAGGQRTVPSTVIASPSGPLRRRRPEVPMASRCRAGRLVVSVRKEQDIPGIGGFETAGAGVVLAGLRYRNMLPCQVSTIRLLGPGAVSPMSWADRLGGLSTGPSTEPTELSQHLCHRQMTLRRCGRPARSDIGFDREIVWMGRVRCSPVD